MKRFALPLAASAMLVAGCTSSALAAEDSVAAPVPTLKANETGLKTAVFAGGCFWGIEGVFSHVKGVSSAVSGYHGGSKADADYDTVSGGGTGHAEAVKVTYDPKLIRYDQLLQIFFSVGADPTMLNAQGPDRGTQYRSALVPMSPEQAKVGSAYLAQMGKSGVWKRPIVTKVETYKGFYPAESYHQDFIEKNPNQGYIVRWDKPKIVALKVLYPKVYRTAFKTG